MKTKIKKLDFYKEPEEAFYPYRNEKYAVFLDSSMKNEQGRYSVIALKPYLILEEKNGVCKINENISRDPIEKVLDHYLNLYKEENITGLPVVSGAFGYLSYDFGRKFEMIPSRHADTLKIPDAVFAFYDRLIIADQEERQLYLASREELTGAGKAFLEMEETLQKNTVPDFLQKQEGRAEFFPDFRKEEYEKAVEQMIAHIEEGDIYIANMTQQLSIPGNGRCYEVFRYLRTYNPSPFGAYMNYGEFQVICASPEHFLSVKDGAAVTRPIKGTRRRGENAKEDALLKRELSESEKDRSELLMIVDLERNDLNRVCTPGSVRVPEHCVPEEYATVFHLVSTVTGKLEDQMSVDQLIKAMFPGGSVTGAPKIRAMEIIDRLERSRRGLYTGSIGYFSLNGDCDFNIVIRTAVYKDGTYHLGVGGGITWESDPEFEHEETMQKAKAVLEAIAAGERRQEQ